MTGAVALLDVYIYYLTNQDKFKDAIRLCTTKPSVARHNQIGLNTVAKSNKLYSIKAVDTYAVGVHFNKKALSCFAYLKTGSIFSANRHPKNLK